MTTENLIPAYSGVYINVLAGYGNSKWRTKTYANMYILVYLVAWDFKTQLLVGAFQFEPPEIDSSTVVLSRVEYLE